MKPFHICITFDVDFTGYASADSAVDELAVARDTLLPIFAAHPHWRATWFVRLDGRIDAECGAADHLARRFVDELHALGAGGHEIGWHMHPYVHGPDGWRQNTDERAVAAELRRYAPLARDLGFAAVRLGWGFHTALTLRTLADLGFRVDSSAIPRPRYTWETAVRDWASTPATPYLPGTFDYRLGGDPHLDILEVPISTAPIPAPYDDGVVIRYFNPAYRAGAFRPAVDAWVRSADHLVTVTHPYEAVVAPGARHELLAFDAAVFAANVEWIEHTVAAQRRTPEFVTISDYALQTGLLSI